jgi:monovalent cation:H+ antiporter, CPA1 family
MLTANATLAIFSMLGISSLAIFWAKRVKLPHTVFLVLIGLMLGILSQFPALHFFQEFSLTPELLFFLLLPTLIFESAYNINIRRLVEDTWIILIISVIGLAISTLVIATGLYFLLDFIGYSVPFIITLLFGALISATDPVAVLALFKEYGAPRRLSLIFEGESLFNDATAVALFLILLEIVTHGYHGSTTIIEGSITFVSMLIGGIIFGVIVGGIFAKLVGLARENETASITLTIVLAHITFIGAEIVSHLLHIGSLHLPLSPIIATTIAALLMGNYGRSKINPKAEEFVEKIWGQFAFLANSLIFILIGVIVVSVIELSLSMLSIIGITIIVVALARAISIYPIMGAYNVVVGADSRIPLSWQHLLSWGSLRGALAVTMVLLIPPDLAVRGWTLSMSPKDFLLAITVGCISATLFIKAPTIKILMRRLKLDQLTTLEEVESLEARALIHHKVRERIERFKERGYISNDIATTLLKEHGEAYQKQCAELQQGVSTNLSERVLRMFAIGIEKKHLKELYQYAEVNESVFKHLSGKLQLQLEAIEAGNLEPNMSIHTDGKDYFERLANFLKNVLYTESETEKIDHMYMYYRAQSIISRKVLKELDDIGTEEVGHIFTPEALARVTSLYQSFKEKSEQKMIDVATKHKDRCDALAHTLAQCGVHKIEETILHELYERQLITPKLFITLGEKIKSSKY